MFFTGRQFFIEDEFSKEWSGIVNWGPHLRYSAKIVRKATAVEFANSIADAAEHGQRLKVAVYVGLLSRAVTNLLKITAELGAAEALP